MLPDSRREEIVAFGRDKLYYEAERLRIKAINVDRLAKTFTREENFERKTYHN